MVSLCTAPHLSKEGAFLPIPLPCCSIARHGAYPPVCSAIPLTAWQALEMSAVSHPHPATMAWVDPGCFSDAFAKTQIEMAIVAKLLFVMKSFATFVTYALVGLQDHELTWQLVPETSLCSTLLWVPSIRMFVTDCQQCPMHFLLLAFPHISADSAESHAITSHPGTK